MWVPCKVAKCKFGATPNEVTPSDSFDPVHSDGDNDANAPILPPGGVGRGVPVQQGEECRHRLCRVSGKFSRRSRIVPFPQIDKIANLFSRLNAARLQSTRGRGRLMPGIRRKRLTPISQCFNIKRQYQYDNSQYQCHQVMFYLGVAYAANIGGTGTLTASEPNVIMKGILDEKFPCQARNLDLETL